MSLRLGPRYRILGPVASGGMGSVMLAVAKDGNGGSHPVALKQLHAHLADDARMVEMFVDEARLASRLSHPNIVRVNDVEMINDDVVLVMDFIEGIPLTALMRKLRDEQKPMPLPVVRRIVHDMLLGLHAAHELRDGSGAPLEIIHRDVSPHNVLLGVDGVARIADFGVAKARGRLANTQADGTVKGKLQYLAPEQVYRKPIDRRVDVFATGIVLWECLTGKRLFAAETEGETLAKVINEPIFPPSSDRLDVALDLDETCLRALERDPKRRWPTADAFARALEDGPLAERADVAALVAAAGAETIAAHRALLEGGASVASPSAMNDVTAPAISVDGARSNDAASSTPRRRRSFVGVLLAVVLGILVGGVVTSRYGPRTAVPATTSEATPSVPTPSAAASPSGSAPTPATSGQPVVERPPSVAIAASAPPVASSSASPVRSAKPRRAPAARGGKSSSPRAGQFEPDDL